MLTARLLASLIGLHIPCRCRHRVTIQTDCHWRCTGATRHDLVCRPLSSGVSTHHHLLQQITLQDTMALELFICLPSMPSSPHRPPACPPAACFISPVTSPADGAATQKPAGPPLDDIVPLELCVCSPSMPSSPHLLPAALPFASSHQWPAQQTAPPHRSLPGRWTLGR